MGVYGKLMVEIKIPAIKILRLECPQCKRQILKPSEILEYSDNFWAFARDYQQKHHKPPHGIALCPSAGCLTGMLRPIYTDHEVKRLPQQCGTILNNQYVLKSLFQEGVRTEDVRFLHQYLETLLIAMPAFYALYWASLYGDLTGHD